MQILVVINAKEVLTAANDQKGDLYRISFDNLDEPKYALIFHKLKNQGVFFVPHYLFYCHMFLKLLLESLVKSRMS